MGKVLVSVICTNYNKGSWISEAIESFLCQKTNFEFEILLIDDKSTDKSVDIIREYAKKYPKKIRAFYNEKNLGITKTWIKICKEAKGKYIARCDGDDYWIDDTKLQKQVDVLEESSESEWCGTDCDFVDLQGKVISKSVFKTGYVNLPKTYAEVLATKGFTAPSTWVAATSLMQQVNDSIDKTAVDDTFNIQLELFNKTHFIHLPDSTVAYRMNEGSDSRPIDGDAAHKRDEKLLQTQLEYVAKYKNVGYEEMVKSLLNQVVDSGDRLRLIDRQKKLIEDQERVLQEREKVLQERDEIIRAKDNEIISILESKKYRLVNTIAKPIAKAKKVLKRRNNQ